MISHATNLGSLLADHRNFKKIEQGLAPFRAQLRTLYTRRLAHRSLF